MVQTELLSNLYGVIRCETASDGRRSESSGLVRYRAVTRAPLGHPSLQVDIDI